MRMVVLLVLLVVCGPVTPARAGEWRWPLEGGPSVSRPFTEPAHRYAAGHRGADLPALPGGAVLAAGDGRVSYAGLVAGRGVVVVVHGSLRTTYEPVSAVVAPGSWVAAGDRIGVLEAGHAGCPAPACLHWGLRRGDDYLDPVRLVAPGPVRLLPLDGPVPVAAGGAAGRPAAVGGPAVGGTAVGGPVVGGTVVGGTSVGRRVLTPGALPGPGSAVSRPADGGPAALAAASLLGVAALGAVGRRRR